MPNEVKIAHIGVAVADISAAAAFYQDVLEAALTPHEDADAAAIVYAICGLAAGLFAGRRQLQRHECLTRFIPRIEGRANAVSDVS